MINLLLFKCPAGLWLAVVTKNKDGETYEVLLVLEGYREGKPLWGVSNPRYFGIGKKTELRFYFETQLGYKILGEVYLERIATPENVRLDRIKKTDYGEEIEVIQRR